MATKNHETNVKVIQSNTIPNTDNLPLGHMAFGKVNGEPKIYGNSDGTIDEYGGLSKSQVRLIVKEEIGQALEESY